jgi:hypothetical protein
MPQEAQNPAPRPRDKDSELIMKKSGPGRANATAKIGAIFKSGIGSNIVLPQQKNVTAAETRMETVLQSSVFRLDPFYKEKRCENPVLKSFQDKRRFL